jgi:hypothetical protein
MLRKWWKERKRQKKARKAWDAAKMGMGGQPLNVIQGIPTAGKSSRNIARLKTCEKVMRELKEKGKKDTNLYKSWAKEYDRRMARFQGD